MRSVKFNGREVDNPLARLLIMALLVCMIPILFLVFLLAVILHPLFLLFGRVGTLRGNGSVVLDGGSFRKAYR